MSTVLTISSQVIHGHVGNSAAAFALERLGHEALQVPTVILSNHPGHAEHAGFITDIAQLRDMIETLHRRGILKSIDAILSGYLPTTAHVDLVAECVDRIQSQNPNAVYCCDPAIGDDPDGLYIKDSTANRLSATLIPKAGIITPNRFELSFLSGLEVSDLAAAQAAARRIGQAASGVTVCATSIPANDTNLANMLFHNDVLETEIVPRLPAAPHGTGDLFAALLLGHQLSGHALPVAFKAAVRGVEAALAASEGKNELELSASQDVWSSAIQPGLLSRALQ